MSRITRFIRSLGMSHAAGHRRLLPLQRPGFPVAVCWSAKSGCTTVLKWFLAHNGLLDEALAYSRWVHDYRYHKLFAARHYLQQCDRILKHGRGDITVIKVIRDPATRAVSSFLHFLRHGSDGASWPGAAMVGKWKADAGLAHQPGLTFRQFLLFVATQQRARTTLDIHFCPQHDVAQDSRVDTYIRLEDLAAGLRHVEEQHGLPHVDVPQLSRSEHHNPASADHAWPGLAAAFTADHRTLDELGTPPAHLFLDADTRALIKSVYRVDYEAYGHSYDSGPAILPVPARDRGVEDEALHHRLRRAA